MKTVTITKNLYTFNELDEEAKERVRQWYLDDETRSDIFHQNILMLLSEKFSRSDLKVTYSLGWCQGDGLNIYGKVNLYDFLDIWEATDKEKRTIEKYLDNSISIYEFSTNHHYSYSCKFIDENNIDDTVSEFIDYLIYPVYFSNINEPLIKKFYKDMIDYFASLDEEYEKMGYKYFYEADDDEIIDCCEANEWFFTENGEIYY